MKHSDFKIGTEFHVGDRRWRVTDVGTRVVVAIRLDEVVMGYSGGGSATFNQTEAEFQGLFNGPPYAVNEVVFDEYDFEECVPA